MLTVAAAEPAAPAEAPPSAELLMYLGEFEDAGGDFVDPMVLDETDPAALPDDHTTTQPGNDENSDEPAPQSA